MLGRRGFLGALAASPIAAKRAAQEAEKYAMMQMNMPPAPVIGRDAVNHPDQKLFDLFREAENYIDHKANAGHAIRDQYLPHWAKYPKSWGAPFRDYAYRADQEARTEAARAEVLAELGAGRLGRFLWRKNRHRRGYLLFRKAFGLPGGNNDDLFL